MESPRFFGRIIIRRNLLEPEHTRNKRHAMHAEAMMFKECKVRNENGVRRGWGVVGVGLSKRPL